MILGIRALTRRRRECLAALHDAVVAAGSPVHYSVVAERLDISPWTAYDLLRALEGEGLVGASYAHRPGVAVGRTQVAFSPTDQGRAALGARTAAAPAEERALRRYTERVAALGQAALRSSRGLDVAGQLGFWLGQAERLPGRTREGLRHLLRSAPEAATGLSMFVAAVYGAITPGSGAEADDLIAAVSAFQARLTRTTAARRERLVRSVLAVLDTRPGQASPPIPGRFLGETP
jgi:hypothetical protein